MFMTSSLDDRDVGLRHELRIDLGVADRGRHRVELALAALDVFIGAFGRVGSAPRRSAPGSQGCEEFRARHACRRTAGCLLEARIAAEVFGPVLPSAGPS